MNKYFWLLAGISILFFSTSLHAQHLTTGSEGCRLSDIERTVTFCGPTEGATITEQFQPFFLVKDSLPHTWCLYIDGIKDTCQTLADTVDWAWGGLIGSNQPGWHRLTIVVFDSQGTFKNTVRFRIAGEPQCTVPSGDRQILICSPLADARVTSPLHISGVGNSTSVPANAMVAYVDGVHVEVGHTTPLGGLSDPHTPTISAYVPVPLGKHTVALQVVDKNNNKFAVTETVEVVPAMQHD